MKPGALAPSMSPPARRVYVGLTDAQRRRMKRNWIALIGMWCVGASILPLVQWLSGSNRVDLTIVLAVSVPLLLVLLIPLATWHARRRRQEAMAAAGLICSQCAYSMQGLASGVLQCPECGHPRAHLPKNNQAPRPRPRPGTRA